MPVILAPLDIRIPSWDASDLCDRDCPTCGQLGAGALFTRPDKLLVRFCSRCFSYYVSPSPSPKQLDIFYANYDTRHRPPQNFDIVKALEIYRTCDPLADIRIREAAKILDIAGKRILDVGFGRAYTMNCLQRLGAAAYGLEVDPQAIAIAGKLGFSNIFKGDLASWESPVKYDAIVMFDFIEHPLAPRRLLEKAVSLLKPGGFLLISTPNGEAIKGKERITLRVDLEHMQYWTPATIRYLSRELSMDISHLQTYGQPALSEITAPLGPANAQIPGFLSEIKKGLKSIPLLPMIWRFKESVAGIFRGKWPGNYILFCILRKRD